MVGFDLECVELAGKLALEQGDADPDQSIENYGKKAEKDNSMDEINAENSESEEKLINFENLKLVNSPQITPKSKIEELD